MEIPAVRMIFCPLALNQALNETKQSWEAVQAATRAAELLPDSADVAMTLARCQLNLGEVSERMRSQSISTTFV